jgi:predicted GNAT superfamily acetyltransferase
VNDVVTIDEAIDCDTASILKLNELSVAVLNPMDEARYKWLSSMASILWCARVDERVAGFLLGFSEGCNAYDSDNYRWFNRHYDNFIYVDRIVIDAGFRSAGIGRAFYQRLEDWARQQGKPMLCAEVDIEPPNPGSLKFHQRQGFAEVGQQAYGDEGKRVILMAREL